MDIIQLELPRRRNNQKHNQRKEQHRDRNKDRPGPTIIRLPGVEKRRVKEAGQSKRQQDRAQIRPKRVRNSHLRRPLSRRNHAPEQRRQRRSDSRD